MQLKIRKKIILALLCFCIITGVLIAGLWPFNFFQKNSVSWLNEKDGVSFKRYGIIYGKEIIDQKFFKDNQITVEMALRSKDESGSSLSHIISFFNIEDNFEDFIISQWRTHVILLSRNGNYTDVNKYRKCGFRYALPIDSTIFLTVTSGKESTTIYINGKPANKCKGYSLIPEKYIGNEQLIVGNSPTGKAEWTGEMYALAIYNTLLSEEKVFNNYEKWKSNTYGESEGNQAMLYLFDERTGTIVNNKISSDYQLVIPPLFKTLKKEMLSLPRNLLKLNRSSILDILLNILGFIPIGFFLAIGISETRFHSKKQIYILTIFSGLIISLIIEMLQTFLPSRDSSMLDLALNVAGTFIGVLILHIACLFTGPGNLAYNRGDF